MPTVLIKFVLNASTGTQKFGSIASTSALCREHGETTFLFKSLFKKLSCLKYWNKTNHTHVYVAS